MLFTLINNFYLYLIYFSSVYTKYEFICVYKRILDAK